MGKKRQKDQLGNRGSRKLYRNKKKCLAYKLRGQRERNKARRIARILKGFRHATEERIVS